MPTGWELVSSSRFARVAFHAGEQLYYKEFLPRGFLEEVKALAKGSRGRRARLHSEALIAAGFPAPENVAWGSLPGRREYLFTRAVPGQGVTHWLRDQLVLRSGEQLAQRRQLLRQLGHFIGRMHAAGFIHGDLRTSNVLAHQQDGDFQFILIDNERTVRVQPPSGKAMLRNLMQLNMLTHSDLSPRDRMRFFTGWRAEMHVLNEVEAKVLAREAYQWAMRRLAAKGKL